MALPFIIVDPHVPHMDGRIVPALSHALMLCRKQQLEFVCEVKRHRFYQPITLAAALAIAETRPGLVSHLDDQAYQEGLARLSRALEVQGATYPESSETALVKIWAQKTAKADCQVA